MAEVKDFKRIISQLQSRLDDLSVPEIWHSFTKNMECGEYREFKQSCIDDEIVIEVLQKQIPMNPVRKYRKFYSDDYCPVCGKQQKTAKRSMEKPWFCERCGQKLGWEGFNQ